MVYSELIFRRRRGLFDEINSLINRLNIVLGKLGIAGNALRRHKVSRGLDLLSLATSLHGLPVTYRDLANTYILSADRDISRVQGRIKRLINKYSGTGSYHHVAVGLNSVLRILSEALDTSDLEAKKELVSEAISTLTGLREYAGDYKL